MWTLVAHAGRWQGPAVQNAVLASSYSLADAWDEFIRPFCLSRYKHFQIFNCEWRVGGKYWLFYNLISSSVWMLFAAERGKEEIRCQWEMGPKTFIPLLKCRLNLAFFSPSIQQCLATETAHSE